MAFMLRDGHRLKVLESRMLRKILGPKREKLRRLKKCIMRFIICTFCQIEDTCNWSIHVDGD
jgi:hypothetical protein